jgi:starch synthase
VAPTGGLKDSVIDADADREHGSGFVMKSQDWDGFEHAVARAFAAYANKARWARIQRNGMTRPFGWEQSAAKYAAIYESSLANVRG